MTDIDKFKIKDWNAKKRHSLFGIVAILVAVNILFFGSFLILLFVGGAYALFHYIIVLPFVIIYGGVNLKLVDQDRKKVLGVCTKIDYFYKILSLPIMILVFYLFVDDIDKIDAKNIVLFVFVGLSVGIIIFDIAIYLVNKKRVGTVVFDRLDIYRLKIDKPKDDATDDNNIDENPKKIDTIESLKKPNSGILIFGIFLCILSIVFSNGLVFGYSSTLGIFMFGFTTLFFAINMVFAFFKYDKLNVLNVSSLAIIIAILISAYLWGDSIGIWTLFILGFFVGYIPIGIFNKNAMLTIIKKKV